MVMQSEFLARIRYGTATFFYWFLIEGGTLRIKTIEEIADLPNKETQKS